MGGIAEGAERGHEVTVTWNGAPVRAWVPHLLTGQDFEVGVRTARRTEASHRSREGEWRRRHSL